jgi:hypothetical protein
MGLGMSNQQSFDPTPRPALRKASDTSVNPVAPAEPKPFDQTNQDLSLTGNTGDSVRAKKKEKLIAVTVSVPKSLRKKLKKEAKSRGLSFEDIVAERLETEDSRR